MPPEGPRTHDLVEFVSAAYDDRLPDWVDRGEDTAWAVVRREMAPVGCTAAGLRGRRRSERQALLLDDRHIVRRVTPESLVCRRLEGAVPPRLSETLDLLAAGAGGRFGGRAWGPTGSVGFQLATGLPVVRETSDLDIIIRASAGLSRAEAGPIAEWISGLPCRVDALIEAAFGALALTEWAATTGDDEVLLRTSSGPRLTRHPWQPPVTAAR